MAAWRRHIDIKCSPWQQNNSHIKHRKENWSKAGMQKHLGKEWGGAGISPFGDAPGMTGQGQSLLQLFLCSQCSPVTPDPSAYSPSYTVTMLRICMELRAVEGRENRGRGREFAAKSGLDQNCMASHLRAGVCLHKSHHAHALAETAH